jgi:hypothetical protein
MTARDLTRRELRQRLGLSPEPARKLTRRQQMIAKHGSYQGAMGAEERNRQSSTLLALLAVAMPSKPRRASSATRGSSVTDGSGTR